MRVLSRLRIVRLLSVAAAIGLWVALCILITRATGWEPMAVLDVVVGVAIVAWLALLVRSLRQGRRLTGALRSRSVPTRIQGIECRVVFGPERRAFVLGAVRPTIYIGEALLEGLDTDELRAVLLHEDFHRRTLGPLRAASLEAWRRLALPLGRVEAALTDRLVDLERAADRYAVGHGASPAGVASALVKVDAAGGSWVAFASAADRRVGGLLEFTSGLANTPDRLPYEWLAPAATVLAVAICHVAGVVLVA